MFEQEFVLGLVETLDTARDIIQTTPLPPNFQFLKEGYEYQLVPQELTIVGRRELFDHGVEYASLSVEIEIAGTVLIFFPVWPFVTPLSRRILWYLAQFRESWTLRTSLHKGSLVPRQKMSPSAPSQTLTILSRGSILGSPVRGSLTVNPTR